MKKAQTVSRKDHGTFKELVVHSSEHTPSWKRPGNDGSSMLTASTHANGEWLQLNATECSYGDGMRTVSRQTMLTLDKGAAIALRDMLNEAFP